MSYAQLRNDPSFEAFSSLSLADENNVEAVAMRIKSWFESCQDIAWLLITVNQRTKTVAILIQRVVQDVFWLAVAIGLPMANRLQRGKKLMLWTRAMRRSFFLNAVDLLQMNLKLIFWSEPLVDFHWQLNKRADL